MFVLDGRDEAAWYCEGLGRKIGGALDPREDELLEVESAFGLGIGLDCSAGAELLAFDSPSGFPGTWESDKEALFGLVAGGVTLDEMGDLLVSNCRAKLETEIGFLSSSFCVVTPICFSTTAFVGLTSGLALMGGGIVDILLAPDGAIDGDGALSTSVADLELGGRLDLLLDVGREGKRGAGLFVVDIRSRTLAVDLGAVIVELMELRAALVTALGDEFAVFGLMTFSSGDMGLP
jgi:hypothetical protein